MKSLTNFHKAVSNLLENNCGQTTTTAVTGSTSISTSTPSSESCESQFIYLSSEISNISLLYQTKLHDSELTISQTMDDEQSEIQKLIQSSSSSESCKAKINQDFDLNIPANLYSMCISDVELNEENLLSEIQLALESLQNQANCNMLDASGKIVVSYFFQYISIKILTR